MTAIPNQEGNNGGGNNTPDELYYRNIWLESQSVLIDQSVVNSYLSVSSDLTSYETSIRLTEEAFPPNSVCYVFNYQQVSNLRVTNQDYYDYGLAIPPFHTGIVFRFDSTTPTNDGYSGKIIIVPMVQSSESKPKYNTIVKNFGTSGTGQFIDVTFNDYVHIHSVAANSTITLDMGSSPNDEDSGKEFFVQTGSIASNSNVYVWLRGYQSHLNDTVAKAPSNIVTASYSTYQRVTLESNSLYKFMFLGRDDTGVTKKIYSVCKLA